MINLNNVGGRGNSLPIGVHRKNYIMHPERVVIAPHDHPSLLPLELKLNDLKKSRLGPEKKEKKIQDLKVQIQRIFMDLIAQKKTDLHDRHEEVKDRQVRGLRIGEGMDLFLAYKSLDKKDRTVYLYRNSLKKFNRSCSNAYIRSLSTADEIRFKASLKKDGLSYEAQRTEIKHVNIFLQWCMENTFLGKNKAPDKILNMYFKIKQYPKSESYVRPYTEQDLGRLEGHFVSKVLESMSTDKLKHLIIPRWNQLRAHIILMETGIRGGEVIDIQMKHFKESEIDLPWRKGDVKKQNDPFNNWQPPISNRLKSFLIQDQQFRQTYGGWTYYLDNGKGGRMFSNSTSISHFLKKANRKLGLEKYKPAHAYRASLCTRSLNEGVGELTVQALMGHRQLSTTRVYAPPRDMDKLGAVNALKTCTIPVPEVIRSGGESASVY